MPPARRHHTCLAASTHCRATRQMADRGMSTAEYAIGTLAATAFAAVLYVILTSDQVQQLLVDMVTSALSVRG